MSGFGPLLRQRVRRDALQVALWGVGTALLGYLAYVGVAQSYGTEQDRVSLLGAAVANPVIMLFRGLPSGAEEGAFMAFLIVPWLSMLAAFMSTFLAVRHTRGDEEAGRAELVAATPAARVTPLLATIAHGLLANLFLAALTAAALLGTGLPITGSLVTGAAAGATGVVFLGVGLVAGQLLRTSRGANSLAVWTLIAAFLACGIGNALGTPSDDLQRIESSWLAWLSPFGWAENSRPYADDALWPLLLCVGIAGLLCILATVLQGARDIGESFVAERRGRATATAGLSSPAALVWRLSRGAAVGWAVGGLITGLMSTSLASIIEEVGAENPAVEQILAAISGEGDAEQGTVTVFFTMLGVIAACAAVQTICRARQEEARGTAEIILSHPVDRVRWLGDYLVVAFAAVVLVALAGVAGAAIGIASQSGDAALLGDVAVLALGQVAAASVFLVITALVFVVLPRATIAFGWTLVLVGMVLGLFGPLFGFPDWLVHLSPIAVTPIVQGGEFDARGLWWLLAAVAVGAAGALGLMRRRELAADG